MKRSKRTARRKYRAMAKLKYQQGFLKHELPFTYHGEANANTFKKWVREVREWKLDSRLSTREGLHMVGNRWYAHRLYINEVLVRCFKCAPCGVHLMGKKITCFDNGSPCSAFLAIKELRIWRTVGYNKHDDVHINTFMGRHLFERFGCSDTGFRHFACGGAPFIDILQIASCGTELKYCSTIAYLNAHLGNYLSPRRRTSQGELQATPEHYSPPTTKTISTTYERRDT